LAEGIAIDRVSSEVSFHSGPGKVSIPGCEMRKLIDLSVPTESSPSEPLPVEVRHQEHSLSVEVMKMFFGCGQVDLPGGLGWANDTVNMISHAGTHVDAPWHYAPLCEGKKARTIDQMPLEWFYNDGVVLDMRYKPRGSAVGVDDLREALNRIRYEIKPWDIVLIQTGPFWALKEEFARTGDKGLLWGAHYAGIDKEYCHIEKLANLDQLPRPFGFEVVCFPVKLTGGSAGWSRVVAILED
jgi:kynurenine formamidase